MSELTFPGDESSRLSDVRAWLGRMWKRGVTCPACKQRVHLSHRKLNSGMARVLIALYRTGGLNFQDKSKAITKSARDESLLRFWGLIEEDSRVREDGGHAGWWRVTEKGEQFIQRKITVPSHIWHFNSQCYGLDGEQITIHDALGKHFDLAELLYG